MYRMACVLPRLLHSCVLVWWSHVRTRPPPDDRVPRYLASWKSAVEMVPSVRVTVSRWQLVALTLGVFQL